MPLLYRLTSPITARVFPGAAVLVIACGAMLHLHAEETTDTDTPREASVNMVAAPTFGGQYSVGRWMPFRVTLRNQGRAVDGRLVLGGKDVSFEENVSLPENSQKTLTICGFAKDEEALNRVTVAFVSGRKTLAKNTFSNRVLWDSPVAVSYTHLTLPTSDLV